MWAEFPTPTLEEWLQQVAQETSGKTPEQLSSRSWEGLLYPACAQPGSVSLASSVPGCSFEKVYELQPDDRLSQLGDFSAVRGPLRLETLLLLAQQRPAWKAVEVDLVQEIPQLPSGLEIRLSSLGWLQQGVDAVHELAWTLAGLIETLRGWPSAAPLPQLALKLGAGPRLLLETAKFRAARHLWDQVMAGFGLDWPARIHLLQDPRFLTQQDPHNNLLRSTLAALVGHWGGACSVELWPCQEGPEAQRWSENVVHLLQHESLMGGLADPVAGSGCLEHLTRALAEQAWSEVRRIEASGGLPAQQDLELRATEQRLAFWDLLRRDKLGLVGVNRYVALGQQLKPSRPQVVYPQSGDGLGLREDQPLHLLGLLPTPRPLRWSQPFEDLYRQGQGKALKVVVEASKSAQAKLAYLQQWLALAGMVAEVIPEPPAAGLWMLCSEQFPEVPPPAWAGQPPEGYAGLSVYRGCDRVYCLEQILEALAREVS